MKKVIATSEAPTAVGPYSQAIATGNFLFCAGQIPLDPATGNPSEPSMAMTPEEIIALFKETDALLDGHFVLRSGLHSRQFFQCAILLQHTTIAARICAALAEKLSAYQADSVISPALGGL